ncbi:hypothetical protein Hypma_016171 [Hypsizygus marmoreus]|uniref:Uncharacterized protein n=1 Tax=Hypsizygus marmoreus TaxID=39966 RepID=A0A369J0Q9_HYPMA|nr:hypothetical protein Hypma_016171 [Hypsizygus marmoreus]
MPFVLDHSNKITKKPTMPQTIHSTRSFLSVSSSSSSSPSNPPILVSTHHIPHHSSCPNIHCSIPFAHDYTFINPLRIRPPHIPQLLITRGKLPGGPIDLDYYVLSHKPDFKLKTGAHVFIASHGVLVLKEVFPHAGKRLPGLRVFGCMVEDSVSVKLYVVEERSPGRFSSFFHSFFPRLS